MKAKLVKTIVIENNDDSSASSNSLEVPHSICQQPFAAAEQCVMHFTLKAIQCEMPMREGRTRK